MPPYLGMYIHMHWAYRHPYAARTWSMDEWRGYASGLQALGYRLPPKYIDGGWYDPTRELFARRAL